ncbi:hypothetical protein CWI75_15315 [Kineobactrum sediminis]|uniref:HTH lacI-type domain-containing protein n=1 Tax=Kineobactrum sediminis TaxID=1905677 RepID=A0A2N5XZ75_9GAMM|nr:LacI family DNA-binding transcriptional regulator [Kineobactrum sediminis]PLW81399.1 hypothetical protein CWI75_15315 [Kineobactrum sediminis]
MASLHSSITPKHRATIREVAEIAGVSISTVSRALTGHRGVGDQTRSRVVEIAKKVGYQPSGAARSLRTSRSLTIAMLAPDLENPGNQTEVRTAISVAAARGYSLMVFDYSAGSTGGFSVINRIRESDVDGVLLGAARLKVTRELLDLLESGIPVESVGESTTPHVEGTFIVDNATWFHYDKAACTHAARRLFSMGHRQVAYIDWRDQSLLGRTRFQAFQECAIAHGLPESSVTLLKAAKKEEAVGLVQHALANSPTPTAIISGNGVMTPYTLEGIHSAHARIPDDLSFIAFGDSPWHRAFQPSLSVIRRNIEGEAAGMVERLIARIEGREVPEPDIQPTEFIDRASIAPPPQTEPD